MKFESLTGANVLTLHGQFHVKLRDKGLQLIRGENDDDSSASSNGAGKSSLVDALCWCLYGVTARGAKGDEIINRAAKKNAFASVTVSLGTTRYCIARYRKDATCKNSLRLLLLNEDEGIGPIDLSKGTDAETQKEVEKVLGCSYEVFVAAVYSGQEIMPDLPRMKDRELKRLIEEAAGMERIEAAYDLARERLNTAKTALTTIEATLLTVRGRVSRTELDLNQASENARAWEEGRAGRVAAAQKVLDDATERVAVLTTEENAARARYELAKPHIEKIDLQLAQHKTLLAADQAAQQAVTAAERAVNVHALQQARDKIAEINRAIADPDKYRLQPCKECGTVLESMTREDYLAHRVKHLHEANLKLASLMHDAWAQKKVIDEARAHKVTTAAAVPDVSLITSQRAALMKTKDALDAAGNLRRSAEVAADKATFDADNERRATNPYDSAVAACKAGFGAAVIELETAEKKALALREEFLVATEVAKVFGPAGVRAQILDTVTPFLNDRTSEYLSVLSDGQITATWTTLTKSASGDLKEKFSIEVEHAKGGESFALISGGEKRKVRLACALALQDLVASRAIHPIDLWIGDEIDDALDPAGLERLMTILERKARERGTVLVISHSDLRDWIDNVTTVRKHAQFQSRVEGSLCS